MGLTMTIEPNRQAPEKAVSARFAGLSSSNTLPELALRRELHRRGLRFRVFYKVPGLPRRTLDIAFTRRRVAIFVDGCFWHGCAQHYKPPGTNAAWWAWKIERNRARDADTDARLAEMGWSVVRVWEHEDARVAADRIVKVLR